MRASKASGAQGARAVISRWFNLGLANDQIGTYRRASTYGITLAKSNIAGALAAFAAFLLLEHVFVAPDVRVMDMLAISTAMVVGIMLSQRKTSSHRHGRPPRRVPRVFQPESAGAAA